MFFQWSTLLLSQEITGTERNLARVAVAATSAGGGSPLSTLNDGLTPMPGGRSPFQQTGRQQRTAGQRIEYLWTQPVRLCAGSLTAGILAMSFQMQVQKIIPDGKINATRGIVAQRFGPLIYNVEKADQPDIE